MLSNIIGSIICAEFDRTFGRNRLTEAPSYHSDSNNAMQVRFSLDIDHDIETGYRHLKLLLFGDGSRYIGVYAQIDWNVKPNACVSGLSVRKQQEGNTGWVLLGCHDLCWRESVSSVLFQYRERLSTIDYLFNGQTGWFKSVPLNEDEKSLLRRIRTDAPGYGSNKDPREELKDLEFTFLGA